MQYQWYPGHMRKAKRLMQEDVKLVDVVVELVDARIPFSSRNPDIDEIARGKARVLLLNKADLADDSVTKAWQGHYEARGFLTVALNSKNGGRVKQVSETIQAACRDKLERDKRRGMLTRPVRAMVVGIPNVGKSTFINSFAGRACAKTGNKPGVTKGRQWIRLDGRVELLDTPGLLWPKFEDQKVGRNIALIGSINADILLPEELSVYLLSYLAEWYPELLEARFPERLQAQKQADKLPTERETDVQNGQPDCELTEKNADQAMPERQLSETEDDALPLGMDASTRVGLAYLERAAVLRGCLKKGGVPDLTRAATIVLDEFRSGKLGRVSLERVKQREAVRTKE